MATMASLSLEIGLIVPCENCRSPRPVPKLGPFEIGHKSAA